MTTMNYDPNMTNSGRMAVQRVQLTFGQWDYRSTMTADVGGNCTGLDIIAAAVEMTYDQLQESATDLPALYMIGDDNEVLVVEDDEDKGDDFLREMLVAAEILSIEEVKQ